MSHTMRLHSVKFKLEHYKAFPAQFAHQMDLLDWLEEKYQCDTHCLDGSLNKWTATYDTPWGK